MRLNEDLLRDPVEEASARGVLAIKRDVKLRAFAREIAEMEGDAGIGAHYGVVYFGTRADNGRGTAGYWEPATAARVGWLFFREAFRAWRQRRRLPR